VSCVTYVPGLYLAQPNIQTELTRGGTRTRAAHLARLG
jgi:hypothetical protein